MEKCCRAGQATDDNITKRMSIACCIPKARNPHLEYLAIIAFPLQHSLHERASILRCTYTTCLFQEENRFMELVI